MSQHEATIYACRHGVPFANDCPDCHFLAYLRRSLIVGEVRSVSGGRPVDSPADETQSPHPQPGVDQLDDLTDSELRQAIREYGLSATWDDHSGTLLDELHARHPRLAGVAAALSLASQADYDAVDAELGPDPMRVSVPDSPATAALRDAYDHSLGRLLAEPEPAAARARAALAAGAAITVVQVLAEDLDDAAAGLRAARKWLRAATAGAREAARAALAGGMSEVTVHTRLGVTRTTLREWIGKRR